LFLVLLMVLCFYIFLIFWAIFWFDLTSLNPVPNAQVCVYLTIHITKLQLQTTFPKPLYTTFRMYPSGPWLLKILMFALLVTHEIATYS
jgi:hypothetical protein